MPFTLPERVSVFNLGTLIELKNAIVASGESKIVIDASRLRYIDPAGLCVLTVLANQLGQLDIELELRGLEQSMAQYLERMDLFRNCHIGGAPSFTGVRRESEGRFVELQCLDAVRDIATAATRLARTLVGKIDDVRLDTRPDEMTGKSEVDRVEGPLNYVLDELVENALTHAKDRGFGGARAWIAAQYYPNSKKVRLAVVDDGCGFLESLRTHAALKEQTHVAAIEAALQPRVSRNRDVGLGRDSGNQGVGLTVTRQIAMTSGGFMTLFSGDGWIADAAGAERERKAIPRWQGAGVYMELKREQLRDVDVGAIVRNLPGYMAVKGIRFE